MDKKIIENVNCKSCLINKKNVRFFNFRNIIYLVRKDFLRAIQNYPVNYSNKFLHSNLNFMVRLKTNGKNKKAYDMNYGIISINMVKSVLEKKTTYEKKYKNVVLFLEKLQSKELNGQ
jgi:hypothetical protein